MVLGGECPGEAAQVPDASGYDVIRVADTRTRESGTDVIARKAGRILHVEVKGWPSGVYCDPAKAGLAKPTSAATQARVWFNDAVVHALRLRDAHADDDVGMCFPDQPTHRRLVTSIGTSLKRCCILTFFVAAGGSCQAQTDG